jgi:hypothetical protein
VAKTLYKIIPNYTFKKLEKTLYKHFQIVKSDEEFYMQLKNFQLQVGRWVKAYYEHLLKLANCLQVKANDVQQF